MNAFCTCTIITSFVLAIQIYDFLFFFFYTIVTWKLSRLNFKGSKKRKRQRLFCSTQQHCNMAQEAKMCAVSKACMCTFVHSRVWVCACVFVCACTYIHTARYGSFMFLSCCVGETRQLCEFIRACLSLCLNSFIIHKKCVPAAETWVRIATIHAFLKNFVDIGTALWKKSQTSFVVFFSFFTTAVILREHLYNDNKTVVAYGARKK